MFGHESIDFACEEYTHRCTEVLVDYLVVMVIKR